MRILGVDPGLSVTGYGIIDFDNRRVTLVEAGVIQSRKNDLLPNRISKIYKNLNDVIIEYRPQVMVLEKLYTHYLYSTTSCILGHVRGVICLLCAQHGLKFIEQGVRRTRQTLTGRGEASKLQTQRMVVYTLGLKENQLTVDASDALALALGYVQTRYRKISKI